MEVGQGTEAEAKAQLASRQAAAARLAPRARFTATPRSKPPDHDPLAGEPEQPPAAITAAAPSRDERESRLRGRFRNWLTDLDDDQLTALAGNWDNVMGDAALDRIDSWIIAETAIAALRDKQAEQEAGS